MQAEGVEVEVALQWCSDSYSDTLVGFVNSVKTVDGGTHLDGLKSALTRIFNALAKKTKALKEGDSNLSGDHVREGLSAIISVKVCFWPVLHEYPVISSYGLSLACHIAEHCPSYQSRYRKASFLTTTSKIPGGNFGTPDCSVARWGAESYFDSQ